MLCRNGKNVPGITEIPGAAGYLPAQNQSVYEQDRKPDDQSL